MIKRLLFLFPILFFYSLSVAQTLKDLEQRRKKTEQEIELTTKLISETESKKVKTLDQLIIVRSQLNLRRQLVKDIERQISMVEIETGVRQMTVEGLHSDLNNLKREYAKLIQFAWKNKSDMNLLMFLFASNDFNQAYKRLRFYQQFINFREKQGREIIATERLITSELNKLSDQRKELAKLIGEKNFEVDQLSKLEVQYNSNIKSLQTKEKQLKNELEERKKSIELLNKAIEDLIAEEARKAAQAKPDKVRDARYLKLSEGFLGNKGKLPWPTAQGVIVGHFGEHFHPVLKDVKIKNNGVDISTTPNAPVLAIFEGEVKKIVNIPGSNTAVIIRHGDYLSVYSNIVKVAVKVGDYVRASQVIGEAFTETGSSRGILNLQIWKESETQNPVGWLLP